MNYRNQTIMKQLEKMTTFIKLPKNFAVVVYVSLSPVLLAVEEMVIAYETRKQIIKTDETTQKNSGLGPKTITIEIEKQICLVDTRMYTTNFTETWPEMKPFNKLLESEKKDYNQYYNDVSMRNEWLLQVMARESSIQLTLQNALVMYEFVYPPIYELDFNTFRYPSIRWMFGIALQLFSIVLSAYSTYNPILVSMKFKADVKRENVGLLHYVITVLQLTCHIAMSAGIVFLSISYINVYFMFLKV